MVIRNAKTFCCLGVLCDRYQKETGLGTWDSFHGFIDNEGNPEYNGITRRSEQHGPVSQSRSGSLYSGTCVTSLTTMNDRTDTFDAVIKLIEENLLMMDTTLKSQWITALRSGDFIQGQGVLRSTNEHILLLWCLVYVAAVCLVHRRHRVI
jgi:hypothetical protein